MRRTRRTTVEGTSPERRPRLSLGRRLLIAFGIASLLLSGLAIRGFWLEPASLHVNLYRLEVPRWPPDCSGLRIALIADLHVGSPFNGVEKLRTVVERTNSARPDLVLIAGDVVIQDVVGGTFVDPESIAEILRGLSAPLGVFAVLGNHDWWLDGPRVARALTDAGIPVLEDRAIPLVYRGRRIWLAGIGDFWEGAHDVRAALAQVPEEGPVLVFTHNPDVFPFIPSAVSVTLAGHTHGGQVWLPLIGRPVVPSRHGQRFAIGHIVEEGRHLFVTPGVGTSIIPVRFLVPPEISVIELHHAGP